MQFSELSHLAESGASIVLYTLVALSIIQLAVILERAILFIRSRTDRRRLEQLLAEAKKDGAQLLEAERALPARVLASGLARWNDGPAVVEELMKSRLATERASLESNLSFLGTLGNNAPFLGLFGTVLGIIHAFADLAKTGSGQASQAVMAGISEALVATAVGLIVALPAVVAYNAFTRIIKNRVTIAESTGAAFIAELKRIA
jgi:biopolymer transport protein ExbB/TolQ